jgi:hypothetical protein
MANSDINRSRRPRRKASRLSLSGSGTYSFASALESTYMPLSAAPASNTLTASAALGSFVDDGLGKGHRQHWHPAAEIRPARIRLGSLGPGRHEPRNWLATVGNSHLVALAYLLNQGSKVLPGFTYACFFH